MLQKHQTLSLLLLLLLSASLELADGLAGGGGKSREWKKVSKKGFFSSAPAALASDDADDVAANAASELPFPPLSMSAPPPSSDVDALATRIAARLEPLLLRARRDKEEDEKKKKTSDSSPSMLPPPSSSRSPSPRSSTTSCPSKPCTVGGSRLKTFFKALLGAFIASALLLAAKHLQQRKKSSVRSRTDMLDALRNLDDDAARRLLGHVSLPGWAK